MFIRLFLCMWIIVYITSYSHIDKLFRACFQISIYKRVVLPYRPVYMRALVPEAGVSDTDGYIILLNTRV